MSVGSWMVNKLLDTALNGSIAAGRKLVSNWRSPAQVENWIPRLNAQIDGVKIFCENRFEPEIEIEGPYSCTDAQREAAKKHRKRLKSIGRPNDPHAIMVGKPLWHSDPVHLVAQYLDFASVCALREEKLKPEILSSSAVVVCGESEDLILHRRAKSIETYPECLHTLGGAYIPPGTGGVDSDRGGLSSTLPREFLEETQVSLLLDNFPPMMMAQELTTGFIQLVFLGINISSVAAKRVQENWEGKPIRVPFKGLHTALLDPTWVPSGKAHVLAWLALGAPGAKPNAMFGGLTAQKLFNSIVGA